VKSKRDKLQKRVDKVKQREKEIDAIEANFKEIYSKCFTQTGRARIRALIDQFGFDEVCTAYDIAVNKYETAQEVFDKLGGVCYNRKIGRKADYYG
jgi:hypothetical protein